MPLSFERRWSLDKRKDDKKDDRKDEKQREKEKKSRREKKKYKTKTEEQMALQIEELNRQVVEERQNTRREKLSVARLQRELAKAKSEGTMKEGVMRELLQEREARSSLEKQLEGALAENKTCNAQLEALQGEIARLRSAASLNSLCDNADSCINERLRHGMSSADTGLSDVERENCNVVVSNKQIEIKMGCKEDKMKEKAMLLERLKQLETENSALVLENENQRDTYEQCLDEVANQVVQALLMQKDLRDECLKLHTKVRDLEHQNRNLRCLFDQNRFAQCVPSPSQYGQRSPYANTSPSLPGRTIPPGPHPASSPSPSPSQSPSPSPCPFATTTFTHPLRSKHSAPTQPALTGASKDSGKDPPLSPRLLPSANSKKDHGTSRLRMPDHLRETPQRDSYPKLLRQQFQQYHHLQQQPSSQHQQQRILPQEFYRQLSAPAKYAPHPSQNLGHQGFQQGRGHMHHSSEQGYLPPAFPAYQCDMPGVEGAGEGMGFEDYTWAMNAVDAFPPMRQSSLPAGLGRLGLSDETLNGNLPTAEDLGARITKMQVMGEDRPQRSSPSDATDSCNGYILGDQYTKPFVHAPFQYAQSLLKELQEISASVKSFESLTLEPKQGSQQKRKAHDGQPAMQRQKLAKNFSPCASNASSESLNSSASPRYLMDSTSSMTSTDSVETTLERIPPVAISQGTPTHRDYNTQWRPEYGGNRLYDSTGSPSRLPPDTPSPPTTDIDPSEKDYQHSKYLRSHQQNVSLAAEREKQADCVQDAPDELNEKGPREPKACEHPQDRTSGSDPPVSVKEKDILNEAQKTVQLMQKENALHCKRATNQPEKDMEREGHYCCQEAEDVRSQVNGRHKEFDDSTESGQHGVKRVGGEVIVESLSCDETSAKHKLNKKLANDCQSHHVESSTTEGVQQVTLPDSESSRSKCPAQPLLGEDDPGQDTSSPVWKRKSQVEASNGEEKCESGAEETDQEESKDRDVRVASFMAASPMVSREGETKKSPRPGAKPNSEASPKRHIGKLQSPKHIPKTSLAATKQSALPATTSKPSGAAELAPRAGSIARADVKVRAGEDASGLPASIVTRQPKLPVLSTKEVTKHDDGATTCSSVAMQAGNLEPTEKNSDRASHPRVESIPIQREHEIAKQVSSQSNQEATDSLLQKTKQHFMRGEVGQCSLNAKMSQLSKLGPAFLDRPLLSRQGNAVAPMTKYSLDVPVLDSSPRLPGRKQMTSPPHHALSLSPSPDHCRTSLGTPGDMVEFTSQSLEEQASEKSMSTESLQSTNSLGSSADWDSPSKNSTTRKSPTPLSQLLSSDSDSEEEAASVNFVDMWKARSTPPIKLPEWDPNRSIEEHRKRVRESLDRTESTSSASSEQWILNYPLPDDPHSPVVRSSSASPASRQSSLTGVARQDSTNSRKGENSCEDDRRILEELLEKERCAEARVGSGQVTSSCKTMGSDRGSNLKLSSNKNPENASIMSDFVSSIMAEIRLEDTSPGNKSSNVSSKDDCVTRKKSNQVLRSQSMKVTSRPQVTRTQSGEKSKRGDGEGPSAPKSNIPRNQSILDARKGEAERTRKANTAADPSSENKRKGAGVSRTSLMPKALTRAGKAVQGNPNENQSRSGSGAPISPNLEKSTLGKVKKLNLKYGKSKAKENESTPKSRSKDSEVKVKDASSDSKGSSSKSKSRIPQLIRQGLKSSPGKSESSKKKNVSSKDSVMKSSIPKTSKAENAKTKEASKPVQGDSAGKEAAPLSKTPSFVVDNVPFIDASSKSPNSEVGDYQASPTKSNVPNANSSSQERLKEGPQRPSPKLSPGLLQRLRASGIELANSSGSDNDSVFLPDEPKCNGTPPKPVPTCNGRVARDRSENGSGSELHLDEKEIEDIKNGLLISDTDALSIGSWSAKSSEFGLKNLFLFGNDESSGNNGSPLTHRSLGRGSIGRGSLVPSVTSTPEKSSDGRLPGDVEGDEDEAKRYNVPLVSSDLMEDFEAEDFRQDDAMSSDREKEAQLTEKERANLLDSLFESDDSEECELDGFLEDSGDLSMDSHPGEREFMKLLGEKGLRRQVVRQSVYCRVSLLQMDIFSLYNRFGDPEKEALACFDFLEEMYVSNAGETHFTDDQSLSLISPQNGVGGMKESFGVSDGIRGCLDTSLLQAEDTKSDPFGQDSPTLTLGGSPFHSKSEPPCGARGENSGPSSGEFSEHFDTECFNARHSNKVFDAIGDFGNHLGNRSNLCSSMSSSSTASLSSHE